MSRIELTVKSSAADRYDTDLVDRVAAILADIEGVQFLYSEGGTDLSRDRDDPDGADNHFVFDAEGEAVERAMAAVEAFTERIPTVTPHDPEDDE